MTSKDDLPELSLDLAGPQWKVEPPAYGALDLADDGTDYESFLSRCGKGAAACTCSVAGGAVLSHIGCLVSPTIAFLGVAGGASVSAVSMGASAALTLAGLGVWHQLRWKKAGTWERGLTLGGAFTGAVVGAAMSMSGLMGHAHDHGSMDEALKWYQGQTETAQAEIRQNAKIFGVPLNDYVLQICGEEQTKTAQSKTGNRKGVWAFLGLDK
ncbi:MAG: hypothetical protein DI626_02235 [Micavibrio aeruginosavorus]|uniref:Uncharacterized protein n=1 Tax=Micavibrio aeruginosavorus TaxID=349221 RepID=A0A2W5BYS8_9BACT|nr:MAG: hypothetical protein DI626_02235 [Micavibrio aeruginosavorus]